MYVLCGVGVQQGVEGSLNWLRLWKRQMVRLWRIRVVVVQEFFEENLYLESRRHGGEEDVVVYCLGLCGNELEGV